MRNGVFGEIYHESVCIDAGNDLIAANKDNWETTLL